LILSLSQDSEHAADLDCLVFESEDGPGSGLGGGNFGGDGTGSSQLGEGVAGIVNEPRLGRIQLSDLRFIIMQFFGYSLIFFLESCMI
jgi:hypothetical protein